MPRAGVEVKGLKEFLSKLSALGVDVEDMKAAFGAISDRARTLAAGFAPKRTGRLAASIKGSKSKNRANVRAGGARVPYAAPIEYGWRKRNIEPQRYLGRADDVMRTEAPAILEDEMSKLINGRGL